MNKHFLAKLVRIFASSHEETHEIPWDLNPITEIGFQFLENKPLEQRVVCLTLSMCPHLVIPDTFFPSGVSFYFSRGFSLNTNSKPRMFSLMKLRK